MSFIITSYIITKYSLASDHQLTQIVQNVSIAIELMCWKLSCNLIAGI